MAPIASESSTRTGTVAEGSPGLTEQAQEKVKEGAEAAKEQAQDVTQQARERAREQVDQRTTDAGLRLKSSAGDARSMAHHLRTEGKDGPARLVEQAADRAEGLGGYLSEADADRLVRDVERYARGNPWAVIAGGLAVGFAASRIVSASSASREVGRSDTPRSLPPARPAATPMAPRPAVTPTRPAAGAEPAAGEPYEPLPSNADLPNYGGGPV